MSDDDLGTGGPIPEPDRTARSIVREVLIGVAPDEVAVYDGLVLFDDDTITRRLRRSTARGDQLGFGVAEVASLATPVVWAGVQYAAQRFGERAADSAYGRLKTLLRKTFRKPGPPATVPALSAAQLAEVREEIRKVAAGRGMDPDTAESVANEVLGQLIAEPPQGEPGDREQAGAPQDSASADPVTGTADNG